MAWDVMSGVTKMAWYVMSGVTKTAWDVLSGVANRVHDISSKALSSNATFRRIRHHVERDYSSNFRRKTTRRMDICRNFVENSSKFGRKMR